MANDRFDFSHPEQLPTEGNRGFRALCGLAAALGAKDPCHQLINNDGSCVGDLMCFFEDNPGAIQAVYDWVEKNYESELVMKAKELNDIANGANHAFQDNPHYLEKVLDKITKLAECGIYGVVIKYTPTVEYREFKKVGEELIKLGYDVELYSSYLQVKWIEPKNEENHGK